ncbi:GNAT family N-acetyltransferase [Aquamicrobium segne]|uniref:GNAT family N-acetyltransferase n=1 Tax=Aquamicrobium segne TaxID=469547 RepID=A0ABW0GZZ3_9HYPH
MAAIPLIEETSGGPAGALVSSLAGLAREGADPAQLELLAGTRPQRTLAIYPAMAGFELVEELDYLGARAIEPNVFFNPRFLAPAMARLDEREVRLAVIRDGDDYRSRLRLSMPFSIARPSIPLGVPVIRTWSNPFGPVGTPLVDHDDPLGVLEDLFAILARPHLRLPKVLVVPDMRLNGPMAKALQSTAEALQLTLLMTDQVERPVLNSELDGESYLKSSLSSHHVREFRRLRRRLEEQGTVLHDVARTPDEVRPAMEGFLVLEAAGWKGRKGTAMMVDRYQAAFAREAVHKLAERDMCRVHTLKLDGRTIASLVVFVEQGVAYTWKTAYDERLAAFSPGTLLMLEVTRQHLDDPNIEFTDSCAVPDHPVMSRLWTERRRMGTLIIGLTPSADRAARQAAAQMHLYREARNVMRGLRNRARRWIRISG